MNQQTKNENKMKTIFNLKWSILSLFSLCLLTSCLSDSDNEFVIGDDLAYITSMNGTKCAAISHYGYIASSAISNLPTGEYYLIDYKLTNPAFGVNQGEVLGHSKDPLEVSSLTTTDPEIDDMSILGMQIRSAYPDRHFADGWLFYFESPSSAKNQSKAYFYYDRDNQIDKNGNDVLQDNKIIIDVYFDAAGAEFAPNSSKLQKVVADLSSLRYEYEPDFSKGGSDKDGNKYVNVGLQFRYSKVNNNSDEAEITYLGAWDSNSSDYYMLFEDK